MSGTIVPEHGGVGFELARDLLYTVANKANISGIDFVELNPPYNLGGISALCASILLIGILGETFKNLKR